MTPASGGVGVRSDAMKAVYEAEGKGSSTGTKSILGAVVGQQ